MKSTESIYRPEHKKYLLKTVYNLWVILLIDSVLFAFRYVLSAISGNPIGSQAIKAGVVGLILFTIIYVAIRIIGYRKIQYKVADGAITINHWWFLKRKNVSITELHSLECRKSLTDKKLDVGRIRIHIEDPSKIIYDGQPQTYIQLEAIKEYDKFQQVLKK